MKTNKRKVKKYNPLQYRIFLRYRLFNLISKTDDVRILIDLRDKLNKEINKRHETY